MEISLKWNSGMLLRMIWFYIHVTENITLWLQYRLPCTNTRLKDPCGAWMHYCIFSHGGISQVLIVCVFSVLSISDRNVLVFKKRLVLWYWKYEVFLCYATRSHRRPGSVMLYRWLLSIILSSMKWGSLKANSSILVMWKAESRNMEI